MGLAVVVGMLAELQPEEIEEYRETLAAVNDVLVKHGVPAHAEPERLPELANRCTLDGYPYSFLHYVRRAYAHRVADPSWVATPLAEDEDPTEDPLTDKVAIDEQSHLLCHSDAEGFYIPIDFREVCCDETGRVPGCMVCSSQQLRRELVFVAPALGIRLEGENLPDSEAETINAGMDDQTGLWLERIVWLSLFEAARLSIEHKAAIWFA